jgi:GPH family glycoside/pentoside/hexuronide:cation symporter
MAQQAPALERPPAAAAGAARLPRSVIAFYTLPTFGTGYMFLLIALYLMKFATDVLSIAPAAMGTIFGLARIWDAVTDPVAGYLSDRTQHAAGRRRPWMFASAFLLAGAFLMCFSPPASLAGPWLVGWMAVAVFGFYTATTVLLMPHLSLGAELTDDYHERSRLFGIRHVTWTLGSTLALVGMSLLIRAEQAGELASRAMAFRQALVAGGITTVLILLTVARLRERPDFRGRGSKHPYRAARDIWANPHSRLLLIVTLIENLGAATIGILTLYISEYVVGTPQLAPLFILSYMVPSFASVPLWIPLSRRVGKKNLWMFSMLLTAFSFGGMFFLREGSVVLISVLAFTAGLAAGCGGTVSPSIQADVIDYDEYQTGERKEGAYYAAWNLVFKASSGLTLMLTGFVLELSGFVPRQEQTETVKLALRSLYALYPMVCFLIGAALFLRFQLDELEHDRIRAVLEERRRSAR